MNLHGIVHGAIAAINPMTPATVLKSSGYTTLTDGTQVPILTPLTASVQMQGLTEQETMELRHDAWFNSQAVVRKLYAYGAINGIIRELAEGGDLLRINGTLWKVVRVFETWPDWSSVAIKQQVTNP